jgi:Membrane dipeptidase (Peptidase family M19)
MRRGEACGAECLALCQIAGDAAHVGIGTDFDGGQGAESTPAEIDTIADLPKLAPALAARGFGDTDIAAVMGGNWLRFLRRQCLDLSARACYLFVRLQPGVEAAQRGRPGSFISPADDKLLPELLPTWDDLS